MGVGERETEETRGWKETREKRRRMEKRRIMPLLLETLEERQNRWKAKKKTGENRNEYSFYYNYYPVTLKESKYG